MNTEQFRQAVQRVRDIDEVVDELDETIRTEAFDILKPYVEAALPTIESYEAHGRS